MYVNTKFFKPITVLFYSLLTVYFSVMASVKLSIFQVAHEYKYFLLRSCKANLSTVPILWPLLLLFLTQTPLSVFMISHWILVTAVNVSHFFFPHVCPPPGWRSHRSWLNPTWTRLARNFGERATVRVELTPDTGHHSPDPGTRSRSIDESIGWVEANPFSIWGDKRLMWPLSLLTLTVSGILSFLKS